MYGTGITIQDIIRTDFVPTKSKLATSFLITFFKIPYFSLTVRLLFSLWEFLFFRAKTFKYTGICCHFSVRYCCLTVKWMFPVFQHLPDIQICPHLNAYFRYFTMYESIMLSNTWKSRFFLLGFQKFPSPPITFYKKSSQTYMNLWLFFMILHFSMKMKA